MNVSLSEKMHLISRYRDKGWAHILRLAQSRGYKLGRYQAACVDAALGAIDPQQ